MLYTIDVTKISDPLIGMIFAVIILIVLVITTITDIKKREVPDMISYGLIFFAVLLRLLFSIFNDNWFILWSGLFGLVICAILGLVAFFAGQWGGGDAKLIIGLGAAIGFYPSIAPLLVIFLINTLLAGALYGIIWVSIIGIINYKKLVKKIKSYTYVIILVSILVMLSSIFFNYNLLILLVGLLIMLIPLMIISKIIQQELMIGKLKVKDLTEGDWIVGNIKDPKTKKIIYRPEKIGITNKNIKILQKSNVRTVRVRNGIPFVPSFLIAYIITMILGNWLIYVFV